MARFVLWGTYCPNAVEKRTPFRDDHLSGLQRQKDRGLLVTLGTHRRQQPCVWIYEADSQSQVEAALHADVYWREGIWTELKVYPWIQAF